MMGEVEDSIEVLRQSLNNLGQVLEILEGFNRRNKNQHRLSKWWAEFNTLRRHLGKLRPEVQANLEKQERYAKYKRKQTDGGFGQEIEVRVEYLLLQLLPRAYM